MYEPQRLPAVAAPIPSPFAASAAARAQELDPAGMWFSFVGTLKRRRTLFLSIFGGIVGLVLLVTLLTPKTYTTTAKLIAGNPGAAGSPAQAQTGLPVLNALMLANTAQSAETYAELFRETPVVQHVIDDLNLKTDVRTLAAAVKVKPVTNTNVIAVDVAWNNPETSARIANDFAAVFVARQTELVANQANGALDFLSKQLPFAENRLRIAERKLSEYQSSHNIADLGAQTTSTVNAAAGLDAKMNAIQLEKQQSDAQIASLSSQLAGMKPVIGGGGAVSQNPVVAQLKGQLATTRVALKSAQQQYTAEHPSVVALKEQVRGLEQQIAAQPSTIVSQMNTVANPVYQQLSQQLAVARATSSSDDAQLGVLRRQRAALTPQLVALPGQSARQADLMRQKKLAEDVYNALQQKYNDATVSRTTALSDVTVTQPASAALATKTPHVMLNLIIAAIAGLLLALAAVFIADWFDGRITDERNVENDLGLPVLASVPLLPSGDGSAMVPVQVSNAAQESYFQLVLAMRYSSDRPLRTVAITSPLKGDGKSTVATNVAAAFGEIAIASFERESRVLLIDADMRRPSLHKKLGVPNDLGLSDILVGRASLADCVKRTDRPGVDVLTSGTHSPNPIKLLQSGRFDALLKEARDRYVTVIVDAPALVPVFDAAIVATKTDGTVMILSAGQTDIRSTRKAMARLEAVGAGDIVGTVMNRSTAKVEDYSDYFAVASATAAPAPALSS